LWPFLELEPLDHATPRSPAELVSALRLSHPSIVANLRGQAAGVPA
jgi:hypothetical protein